MAIPRKTSAVISFKRIEELPRELPALPREVSERFPQMADWNARWSKWWFDFRTILQELDLSDLLKATNSELASFKASTTASLDSLTQQLADQAEEIAAIQVELGDIDLSAILAAIAALQITVTSLSTQVSNLQITVNNQAITINNLLTVVAGLSIAIATLVTQVAQLIAWQTPRRGSGFPDPVATPGRFDGDTYWDTDVDPPGSYRWDALINNWRSMA